MWPDEPFAEGRGSFLRPVPMPQFDPNVEPLVTVSFSCEWLPYVRGALMQLLLQATWQEGTGDLTQTQQRVFDLIDLMGDCDSGLTPFNCFADFLSGPGGFGTITDSWPFGGAIGEYVSLAGWQGTVGGAPPTSVVVYDGVTLDVVLDAPAKITDVIIGYDMRVGSSDVNSRLAIIAYDVDNAAIIGTALTFAELSTGDGQTYHSGGSTPLTSHFAILVACANGTSAPPSDAGLMYVTSLRLAGYTGGDPCSGGAH